MILKRTRLVGQLSRSLVRNPVTALLGPRQCGKTTLAKMLLSGRSGHYFDLENPVDLARLDQPATVLSPLKGLVVIDEIQRLPQLFKLLRVLADRKPAPARFLILGSASLDLIKHSSETLAGRIGFVDMAGFSILETGAKQTRRLWVRGGFPKAFLARSESDSFLWREDFIRTFLERDLPQLGIRIPALTLRRFWSMVAHNHGSVWNGSQIGASLGIAHTTTRQYLDLLTGALVMRQLSPWFRNVKKRLVKAPKVYIRDSGLLHALLQIRSAEELLGHPKLGASWEGFVIEQIISQVGERDVYFWATYAGAEMDVVVNRGGKNWGFEIKFADAPTMTKSMAVAKADLGLEHVWVVYPGKVSYRLAPGIDCIGLERLADVISRNIR